MTDGEFQQQMDRLVDAFGEKNYAGERMRLIHRSVGDLGTKWFERLVDDLISTSKFPPLPADFFEASRIERERVWEEQKRRNAADAKATWEGTYQPQEVRGIMETIFSRTRGEVGDEEWKTFLRRLEQVPNRRPR